ncbi:hypothetical protein P170DRAFT_148918 [Aspergillus steynii IBT 23096]|uniref:Transmembrane protein n=1 Tax=Aspergillus steynii IBT 23096 TaxID=1392250 RepID=A0A2I2GCI9_9EURO|nr:uncharacterized protein P170DRAFT_148918 [Aspergillus steynii IBT 23096]PLB50575.1 hypothetical protein P170DRAFT_148918 [Aspergillus steynii IBT 23096]
MVGRWLEGQAGVKSILCNRHRAVLMLTFCTCDLVGCLNTPRFCFILFYFLLFLGGIIWFIIYFSDWLRLIDLLGFFLECWMLTRAPSTVTCSTTNEDREKNRLEKEKEKKKRPKKKRGQKHRRRQWFLVMSA